MTLTLMHKVHACECDVCKTGADPAVVSLHRQINLFLSCLMEPQRRWYAGTLSQQTNGLTDDELSRILGLDEKTIRRGRQELTGGLPHLPPHRLRQAGGGRPRAQKKTQI